MESVEILQSSLCINGYLECHIKLNTTIGSDLSVLNTSWYHNGTYQTPSSISSTNQKLFTSRLSVMSVTDGSEYTCEASITGDDKPLRSSSITVQSQFHLEVA